MKVKRPAKINKDGSRTLRLYCTHHNSLYTQEEFNIVKENSGLKEDSCFFGLTFRFIPSPQTGGVWILYDTFEEGRHSHTHPFYFRRKAAPVPQRVIDKNELEIIKVVSSNNDRKDD